MSKNTLVIMAAGMGSRFGGVKQLEPVGPSGEIIMDYSIYDAIEAGFKKVVFIIRRDLEEDFREVIGNRLSKYIEIEYVFQELDNLPEGYQKPEDRTKPWGTGQAILSCLGQVKEPFVVINADDYYGKEGFKIISTFLNDPPATDRQYHFCMAGFLLGNTLSENGTVTRGVCSVGKDGILREVTETHEIRHKGDKAAAIRDGKEIELELDVPVSMNMWGLTPDFLNELESRFRRFLDNVKEGDLKAEFLLPAIIDDMIKEGKAEVSVLNTGDKWFGVTYKEDKEVVVESFKRLVSEGVYPEKLFS
ncbi:nucleotidyltransferase family protein [Anaeromicropila populeti]|uniref:Nucleotidyl transferase domain-containing protein n=1 Tax=Anaeromicropila populeti TaxID=37658 RepID=A0A1I6J2S8_9FIRM|nr:sugar phosphate nucleotidyltransferase [Anaeromicropila populeti]SFR73283.1 hypothetical protein SAMN05661086_01395 [Anaeromicropila populeti]